MVVGFLTSSQESTTFHVGCPVAQTDGWTDVRSRDYQKGLRTWAWNSAVNRPFYSYGWKRSWS